MKWMEEIEEPIVPCLVVSCGSNIPEYRALRYGSPHSDISRYYNDGILGRSVKMPMLPMFLFRLTIREEGRDLDKWTLK